METNLLKAIKNIVQNPNNDLVSQYRSLNRMNSMGEALEFYVKDIFGLKVDGDEKIKTIHDLLLKAVING